MSRGRFGNLVWKEPLLTSCPGEAEAALETPSGGKGAAGPVTPSDSLGPHAGYCNLWDIILLLPSLSLSVVVVVVVVVVIAVVVGVVVVVVVPLNGDFGLTLPPNDASFSLHALLSHTAVTAVSSCLPAALAAASATLSHTSLKLL